MGYVDNFFLEFKTQEPRCPCCGAPLPEPRLLVDLNTNFLSYGKRVWYMSPRLAVFAKILIDAWPRTVSKDVLDQGMYGIMDPPESELGNYPTWACVLRKLVRQIGGDVLRVPKRGYRIALPTRGKHVDTDSR